MNTADYVLLAIALVIGVPSARRNPTAGALVLCWAFAVGFYLLKGHGLPLWFYPYADAFVIAVIMTKPNYCEFDPQSSWLREIKCFVLERSPFDRFIIASYMVAWCLYAFPTYQYWPLWIIGAVQFLAAGWDSLPKSIRRAPAVNEPSDSSGDLFRRLAWDRGYG